MPRPLDLTAVLVASLSLSFLACSEKGTDGGGGSGGTSDSVSRSSSASSGGAKATGGGVQTGGASSSAGVGSSGGSSSSGGALSSRATSSTGGGEGGDTSSAAGAGSVASSSGGRSTGTTAAGGGGSSGGTGGTKSTGGLTGGTSAGGRTASGGSSSTGGTSGGNGGTSAPGGSSGGGTAPNTGATVDCNDVSTTTKNFTKQYEDGSLAVTGSSKTYWTMTNWWHKFGGQTVSLNGLSLKVGNPQDASVPASDGNPMGFPSIFIGTYQTKATVGSNLPKKVSDIKSVPTVFQTNASSVDTSNLNATYDVWFTATGDPLSNARASNPGVGGAYLMVWMYKPSQRQPRGGVRGTTGTEPNYAATTVNGVPGKWDVWVDKTDPLCISYVSSTPIDGLNYDLNNFIQDSVTKQYGITPSMYLSLVFAGFEIWSGGDGLELKQFCAAVN